MTCLIDRSDNAIFYKDEVELSKETTEKLRRRTGIFRRRSQSKKQVFLLLVTTFGLVKNKYNLGLADNIVTMDDLF